jgi:hypothetical protein
LTSAGSSPRPREPQFSETIGFWIGREFGDPLLAKWGHLIGLDIWKRMLGRYLFARYGALIVFFGRFVAPLRAFAALLAGANGLAPYRFFAFKRSRRDCLDDDVRIGRLLAWSRHTSHRRAGRLGFARCGAHGLVLWRYYKNHEESLLARA